MTKTKTFEIIGHHGLVFWNTITVICNWISISYNNLDNKKNTSDSFPIKEVRF